MDYHLHPLGERGILIEFGSQIDPKIQQQVQLVSSFLEKNQPEWMIEYIPAFATITILYRVTAFTYREVCQEVVSLLEHINPASPHQQRVVQIPVCYGGELGPDLDFVATHNQLTVDEVIHKHTSGSYLVYMIGFAPGFPYLGGMSEKIAAPRKQSPRLRIPAGSVGIAGMQTGIYPIETPGGWQLIGRTPVELFQPNREEPCLLKPGDRIRFYPISFQEYHEWGQKHHDFNS